MEETQKLLHDLGHQVVALVGDGVWAVSFCKKHKPDLTVLESRLPDLSCEKVIKALRRDDTSRYIIVGSSAMQHPSARLYGDPHIMGIRRPITLASLGGAITLMKNTPKLTMPEWGLTKANQLPKKF